MGKRREKGQGKGGMIEGKKKRKKDVGSTSMTCQLQDLASPLLIKISCHSINLSVNQSGWVSTHSKDFPFIFYAHAWNKHRNGWKFLN